MKTDSSLRYLKSDISHNKFKDNLTNFETENDEDLIRKIDWAHHN